MTPHEASMRETLGCFALIAFTMLCVTVVVVVRWFR
jgi:hypothetical protein